MSDYLTALKDVLVVLSPIIVAYISYRSNKKTKEDIRLCLSTPKCIERPRKSA